MSNEFIKQRMHINRRHFLGKLSLGLGSAALGSLLIPDLFKSSGEEASIPVGLSHFAPKAKRIIYLFQNGAPSQLESFDFKPKLRELHGTDLPESIRQGQRLTGMTSNQERFPLVGPKIGFSRYGKSGAWISDYFPNIGKIITYPGTRFSISAETNLRTH